MKAKSLDDLERIAVGALAPSNALPFNVYLYLETNDRIVHMIRKNDFLSAEMIALYTSRGIKDLWISKEERPAFDLFVAENERKSKEGAGIESPDAANAASSSNEEAEKRIPGESEEERAKREAAKREAQRAAANQRSKSDNQAVERTTPSAQAAEAQAKAEPRSKEEEAFEAEARKSLGGSPAVEARRALKETFNSEEDALKPEHAERTQDIIENAVKIALPNLHELVQNVFGFQNTFLGSTHGVRVSLYATLLGLAFDRTDLKSVSTLAIAALFHDVGFAIDTGKDHVGASVHCLSEVVHHIPRDIVDIIRAHHELFDGTGYPARLSAFEIHPMAQILLMADILDEFVTGKRDGIERGFSDAFEEFMKLEPNPAQPRRFHPEFFRRVMKYVRETDLNAAMQTAVSVVSEAATSLVKKPDAAEPSEKE